MPLFLFMCYNVYITLEIFRCVFMKNEKKRNMLAIAAFLNRPSAGTMQTGKKDKKRERKEGKNICQKARQGLFDYVNNF